MLEVYTGNPANGKTTYLALKGFQLLKKNKLEFEKTGYLRTVSSSVKYNSQVEDSFCDFLKYFDDLERIDEFRDTDFLIDELSLYFDAHNWEALSRRAKKFLRLHRHYAVNIYGATQDFLSVDISFRRLVDKGNLFVFDRVSGSREPIKGKPPIYYPYLFTIKRKVKSASFYDEKINYQYSGFGRWHLFTKKTFDLFDTHQEFSLGALTETTEGYSDLKKIQRVCPEDGYTKVNYI